MGQCGGKWWKCWGKLYGRESSKAVVSGFCPFKHFVIGQHGKLKVNDMLLVHLAVTDIPESSCCVMFGGDCLLQIYGR